MQTVARRWMAVAVGCGLAAANGAARAAEVALTVDPGQVRHAIDPKVYGHFLEHIYHSCNGGLWGEAVWNRSFETHAGGSFVARGDTIAQRSLADNVRLPFGDARWTDVEFSLEARKTGGEEGFLVLLRVRSDAEFYWINFGGWGNKRHGLEKGRQGARWGRVGESAEGSIATGRWYRIRVRCEGPRIRAWLDDTQVIDYTDKDGPHLAGRVGIGTWATQAEFRGLKVAALDGRTLHEGLPPVLAGAGVAQHWQPYGGAQVAIEQTNALNSHVAQRVVCASGEGGVCQKPFFARRGEACRGSLWARGRAPAGLVVRLLDGTDVLAAEDLPAPSAEWREFSFVLKPRADAAHATLQVGVRDGGDVCLDQVSLMPDSARRAGGFRPDLLEAVSGLRPPVIRWPGGCFASPYRWKSGIGPQHRRVVCTRNMWDDLDVNSLGTDEFVDLCRRVGAEPLIVVNIGTARWNPGAQEAEFLQDALDWIEYCNGRADSRWGAVRAANGHREPYGVTYWEIDNETWHMGAESYAEAVRRFAPAMRKADPSIRLAACGSGGFNLEWNRVLVERCADLVDYLSIHHYEKPERYGDGPGRYEAFFRQTAALIAASKNPKLKLYVSEWNAQSTDWRTGLYSGGLLNAFERCGDILELGGPALFLRHVSARAWDNAFINFDHTGWFPAPNYVVMQLWREHAGAALLSAQGDAGPLDVTATRSADGRAVYVKAVNPSDQPVAVAVNLAGGARVRKAALRLVNPGSLAARNSLAAPAAVRAEDAPIEAGESGVRFALPPISAGAAAIRLR